MFGSGGFSMVTRRKIRRRKKRQEIDRIAKIVAERLFAFYYKQAIETDLMLHNNGTCRVYYVSDLSQSIEPASNPKE